MTEYTKAIVAFVLSLVGTVIAKVAADPTKFENLGVYDWLIFLATSAVIAAGVAGATNKTRTGVPITAATVRGSGTPPAA